MKRSPVAPLFYVKDSSIYDCYMGYLKIPNFIICKLCHIFSTFCYIFISPV